MKQKILDHGYVELVETYGSDERIIEAARMSTGQGFKDWGSRHASTCASIPTDSHEDCTCMPIPGDEKLLSYLYRNKHSTPFEMAGLVIEVKAPIFVFRQWHRHRTQSYNEMSARYTPLPNENYFPSHQRCTPPETSNKQARGVTERVPSDLEIQEWRSQLHQLYDTAQALYLEGLAIGIPKELARLPVPVARYSRMRASANLRNWLAFLTLRMDSHAQEEIRVYADAVGALIKDAFPRTWDLFVEGMG